MTYQPFQIQAYRSGLKKNEKPFLFVDDAFQTLENAYTWRSMVKRREGIKLLGRLRRLVSAEGIGSTDGNGDLTANAKTLLSWESNSSIQPGTVTVSDGTNTFTDANADGQLTGAPAGTGMVNYSTGVITINGGAGGSPVTLTCYYFPTLPCMGIDQRELSTVNLEETNIFDTKYSYRYASDNFTTYSATTWAGNDDNFFWMANYRGSSAEVRAFFVTNFTPGGATYSPVRYVLSTADTTWLDLKPLVDDDNTIWNCKIIIPYYGRLLFLNTYEGSTDAGASGGNNYFNRCRFSQIGDPTAAEAWRSDMIGRGGFIDAPTNESIISARFYKNTLLVQFEKSTWNLRYVGEYGLPFLWERISSDFGADSTFSTVLFDGGVLAVGDKAIISNNGNNVERIDLDIPDQVFSFKNSGSGPIRVHGGRDFLKEVVYWCFVQGNSGNTFPNRVLLYNYRNQTWATFRDNITALGPFQVTEGTSWDAPISWDSAVSWDTPYNDEMPVLISGNQQGFIHFYQAPADFETVADTFVDLRESESLAVKAITLSDTDPILIESPNHNLEDGDIITFGNLLFIDPATFSPVTTNLNGRYFRVAPDTTDIRNKFYLYAWDTDQQDYISTAADYYDYLPAWDGTQVYTGGGVIALLPNMNIITKDFNPYASTGTKLKTAYTDIMVDTVPTAQTTVNTYVDAQLAESNNMSFYDPTLNMTTGLIGTITNVTTENPCKVTSPNHGLQTGRTININAVEGVTSGSDNINNTLFTVTVVNQNNFTLDGKDTTGFTDYDGGGYWQTEDVNPYYYKQARYAWHRVYTNAYGQFLTFQFTYDDDLMNSSLTHFTKFELNAMTLYLKPAGKLP